MGQDVRVFPDRRDRDISGQVGHKGRVRGLGIAVFHCLLNNRSNDNS